MQTKPLKIGTRGSPLALAQAHETQARLMAAHGMPAEAFEVVVISTSGDRIRTGRCRKPAARACSPRRSKRRCWPAIDIAVHSSKDMPTHAARRDSELSAFLPREDIRDAFVGKAAKTIADLPRGAKVGSSSLRRQALIRRMRPDLDVVMFRGNVQTRGCASWTKASPPARSSPMPG
jgi:hydroxymethylbilane synthase